MTKVRKRAYIGLIALGVVMAIIIGSLIYADVRVSFSVTPLVVDAHAGWQPKGIVLKIWEIIQKIVRK